MCNILAMKCCVEGCSTQMDMHLADFATNPDEIQVYCATHVPRNPKPDKWPNLAIFKIPKNWRKHIGSSRVGVNSLTLNALTRVNGNTPNGDCEVIYYGNNIERMRCVKCDYYKDKKCLNLKSFMNTKSMDVAFWKKKPPVTIGFPRVNACIDFKDGGEQIDLPIGSNKSEYDEEAVNAFMKELEGASKKLKKGGK